jgi:hypothetical protein
MTSQAKIAANRRNAQRSTGPRTASGKARVRRNALRHGLAALALRDPSTTAEIQDLAGVIGQGVGIGEEAQIIAACEVLLKRVRGARLAIMESMMANSVTPEGDAPTARPDGLASPLVSDHERVQQCLRQLDLLERYERRALSQRKRAVRSAPLLAQPNEDASATT